MIGKAIDESPIDALAKNDVRVRYIEQMEERGKNVDDLFSREVLIRLSIVQIQNQTKVHLVRLLMNGDIQTEEFFEVQALVVVSVELSKELLLDELVQIRRSIAIVHLQLSDVQAEFAIGQIAVRIALEEVVTPVFDFSDSEIEFGRKSLFLSVGQRRWHP